MSTNGGFVDITILGAGPTGLAAAYYAGHRDASVRIVESLEQLGGQVAATYPEKHIYDVAGHPKILGQALVDLCAEQGLQYGAEVIPGEEAKALERVTENGEEVLALTTEKGGPYLSRRWMRVTFRAIDSRWSAQSMALSPPPTISTRFPMKSSGCFT